MAGKYEKRRTKRKKRISPLAAILLVMLAAIAVFLTVRWIWPSENPNQPQETTQSPGSTESSAETTLPAETTVPPTSEETTGPTEPYVVTTASIGASGDVLPHKRVTDSGYSDGKYNYDSIYTYVSDYFKKYDYMVANLETPLAGPDKPYQGYPAFNCPDEIAEGLKYAGVDMLLTANNHSYDMGHNGFMRTQQVLTDLGMDHIGTRTSEEAPNYLVKDINGIKIGMVCYTYATSGETGGRLSLNGITVKEPDRNLVNTFEPSNLDSFYTEFEGVLAAMRNDGAEAVIAFLHWGQEYLLSPLKYQENMAQKLCDMGVDVIVGGHPHVLEPFETLHSESGNTTYCLYSTGNLLSNQRRETLNTVKNENYTEDGIIFGVTFRKWSDGKVEVCAVEATPTWVSRDMSKSPAQYTIVPLDVQIEDWKSTFAVPGSSYWAGSYERTMSIIGEGLNEARAAFGQELYILELD